MAFATTILFLIPSLFIFLAWRASFRSEPSEPLPTWRRGIVIAALIIACLSTLIHFVWNISWLHSGGSPHGMDTNPGLWLNLNRPLLWSFGLAIALSIFARGKGRLMLLAWSVSMYFVFEMVYMLQFD
jgi:hypothetical protein